MSFSLLKLVAAFIVAAGRSGLGTIIHISVIVIDSVMIDLHGVFLLFKHAESESLKY